MMTINEDGSGDESDRELICENPLAFLTSEDEQVERVASGSEDMSSEPAPVIRCRSAGRSCQRWNKMESNRFRL